MTDWPPQFETMKLQARPPEGGDWVDIFPAQLYAMAKYGNDVRAIEGPLSGCQLRGPGECEKEGRCMSTSCVHYGKTECRPRMTVLARDPNVLYPKETM